MAILISSNFLIFIVLSFLGYKLLKLDFKERFYFLEVEVEVEEEEDSEE